MNTTPQRIVKRVRRRGRGAVFTPKDFLDLGSRDTVDQALHRLALDGSIRRLSHGLYDYPVLSRRVGPRSPNPDDVAQALARKWSATVHRSGAHAAHALGLTTQVPSTPLYVTDGPNRVVQAGGTQVVFKKASPKKLVGAGTVSGDVLQALQFIGKDRLHDGVVKTLSRRLSKDDKARLARDLPSFPGWMQPVVSRVSGVVAA